MEFGFGLGLAVVAKDVRKDILIFRGSLVVRYGGIDAFKVLGHVGERFETSWTLVRCLDVLLMAFVVHAVSARLKS